MSDPETKGTLVRELQPFKPKEPKMGGLVQTGREDWTPWVGGKPKSDWSELEVKDPQYIDPRQYRPTSAGSAQKSKSYRMAPMDTKLSKGSDLLDFQKLFMNRLEMHGLDTITYLPDPEDASTVGGFAKLALKRDDAPLRSVMLDSKLAQSFWLQTN